MGYDDVPDVAELAALYAAGALSPDEAAAFERRLAEGDAECQRELTRLDPVVTELFLACPPVEPSPAVRAGLLARVEATRGLFVRRGDEGAWQPSGVPGIEKRILYRDRPRNLVTFLLRMAPGATLPSHPHRSVEECYLLDGDVESMGVSLRAGDYFRAEAGSLHPESRTTGGCLMLIQGADDED